MVLDDLAFRAAVGRLGIDVDLESDARLRDLFTRYAAAIVEQNRTVNLTRITDPEGIARLHFADSLATLIALDPLAAALQPLPPTDGDGDADTDSDATPALRLVDIGSGAGLPGIAIAIARPRWSITLMESTSKKAHFIQRVATQLGLTNVQVVAERAETVGHADLRESFDAAVARAVAPLPVLLELTLPLIRRGGILVALKGPEVASELDESARALEVLGGQVAARLPYTVGPGGGQRTVLVVEKSGATPYEYPRRPGMPAKRPL